MIKVHMRWAMCPSDARAVSDCVICGRPVLSGMVNLQPEIEGNVEVAMCEECLDMLHGQYPEKFPSVKQYREILERYPEPMFATDQELLQREQTGTIDHSTYEAAWLS